MPAGGLALAGAGALMGAGEAIWGNSQRKQYQRQIDALSANRPKYAINPEEGQILDLAQSRAGQGMSAASNQALLNNSNNALSTSLDYALKSGADPNAIGNIAGKQQQALNQNAIYDDQARLGNLNNLQQAYARMSANRDKQFQLNEEQPWKDRMTGLSEQLKGANNMFQQGISLAGSGLMSGITKAFAPGPQPMVPPAYSGLL